MDGKATSQSYQVYTIDVCIMIQTSVPIRLPIL